MSNSSEPGGLTVGGWLGGDQLQLDPGAGQGAQLGQQLGLAGADRDAAVQLGLGPAGDDVGLVAGVHHRGAGGVAQQRRQQPRRSRVAHGPPQDHLRPAPAQQQGHERPCRAAPDRRQRRQEPAELRRGVQGQPAPADPGQELRQPHHRVVVAGDAAVPADPGGGGPQPGHALLGHLDRVEGPPAQVGGGPADLAEGVPGPDHVGVVVDQPGAASGAAGLLVGHRGQLEVAPQPHPEAGQQPDHGHAHGHHLLHVDRAPAPNGTVVDLPGERRVAPAPGLGRDHVDVAVEQQRRLAPVAAGQPGDQVGPARRGRQHLRLDPDPAQVVGEERDALGLVAGRVGGVELQQRPQQLHHRLALPLPIDLLQHRVHRSSFGWWRPAHSMPGVTKYIYLMQRVRKAHQDKVIPDEVTLAFLPGAKIGVVGPNGAGRSTVLKIMAGLETISNGEAALARRQRRDPAPGAGPGVGQ
jgi:hypothetical protein